MDTMEYLLVVFVMVTVLGFSNTAYNIVPCYDNEECEHLLNASCKEFICNCNGSNLCIEKNMLVVTKLGKPCRRNGDCNIDHSACRDDICICREKYVATTDAKTCLPLSEGIGSSCEDSVQCYGRVPASGCQNNKCVCQQQMHTVNNVCYRNVELGQNCIEDEECAATEFSKCVNSTCSCLPGYVASTKGFRCLAVAVGEHAPCVDNVQCTGTLGDSSECVDAFCRCKELYQIKNTTNQCVRDMLLGDKCVIHSDCHGPTPGLSRLECILGVCKCKSFFTEHQGYCISAASRTQETSIFMKIGMCLVAMFLVRNYRLW